MPNDADRNKQGLCPQEAARRVFRNACDFLDEWRRVSQSLSPQRRRVLENVVIQGVTQTMTAAEMGVSRERVRQILEKSLSTMRQAAEDDPRGELAHTRRALTDIAETVGVTTWRFQRMNGVARQATIEQIANIGAITPEQSCLMPAACSLTEKPPAARQSLQPVERSLRRILNLHPDGITPADAGRLMENEHAILDSWPRLDLTQFAVARLSAELTPEGLLHKPIQTSGPSTRRTLVSLMAQALRNAGDCLHIDDIAEVARALAKERGLEVEHSARGCAKIVHEERRFRWVGNSTYGLAEWGVGHSNPEYKAGRRMGIADEIMFLLEQNQTIPVSHLLEHINRRFRLTEWSVRAAIYQSPYLTTSRGLVMRTENAEQNPRLKGTINPKALADARRRAGMSQAQLADRCGASPRAFHQYEIGRQNPRAERLFDMARALGVATEHLLMNPANAEPPSG